MDTLTKSPGARGALRVAVVTETYPPEINGVARTVGLMVEALVELGHEVQLVRPRQGRESVPSPNQSLRERFRLPKNRSVQTQVFLVIAAAQAAGRIKVDRSMRGSKRYARYLPFWA